MTKWKWHSQPNNETHNLTYKKFIFLGFYVKFDSTFSFTYFLFKTWSYQIFIWLWRLKSWISKFSMILNMTSRVIEVHVYCIHIYKNQLFLRYLFWPKSYLIKTLYDRMLSLLKRKFFIYWYMTSKAIEGHIRLLL